MLPYVNQNVSEQCPLGTRCCNYMIGHRLTSWSCGDGDIIGLVNDNYQQDHWINLLTNNYGTWCSSVQLVLYNMAVCWSPHWTNVYVHIRVNKKSVK